MYNVTRNAKDNLEGRESIKEAAHDTVIEMKEDLHDVVNRVSNVANKAGRKVRSFVDTASHEAAHVSKNVGSQIKNKPIQSSLIALGAGLLLGALMRRK